MIFMENKKPSAGTIARLICLILTLVNQVLVMTGHSPLPFDLGEAEAWIATGLTAAASLWAYWKNNSWTPEAIEADDTMRLNKANKR